MLLNTTDEWLDKKAIQEICELKDPVYRNCWITYGYYNISERLHRHIGENASWCTLARWSSATIGESLRLDQPSRRVDDIFGAWFLRPFRAIAQDFFRDVRMLSDAAMPRMLALGNHYVFHEIGYAVAGLTEWYEKRLTTHAHDSEAKWMAAWLRHRAGIEPFRQADETFRPADATWLCDGLECYFRAMRSASDPPRQAQFVLHGNILLAAYEQWRVDPILQVALDPFAKHLVEFRYTDPHGEHAPGDVPRAVLRRQGTPWAVRHQSAVMRWIADVYAGLLTQHVMALDVPTDDRGDGSILLGRGVAPNVAKDALSQRRRIDDSELMKLIGIYDHNRTGKPQGARNWNSFAERMQFIVEVFVALQHDDRLYRPIDPAELALLQLDVSDKHLERLRRIGDKKMDRYVAAHVTQRADARTLVRDLIRSGLRPSLDDELPKALRGELPRWARCCKLERGQKFFREHGIGIASALFTASLPQSYSAEHGARVLTTTAELASGNVSRRVAETGKMLLDVMTVDATREPMTPGTAGSDAARGVRLFHAAVRHMVLADGWDKRSFGYPINQEDLIGTLVVFTVVVLDALEKMGVSVDPEDADCYVHLWMVVGYLLGIDFSLIHRPGPDGTRNAAELTLPELRVVRDAIFRRNARPSADGQSLTAALMQEMRDTMPPGLRQFPAAATRVFLGDEYGDLLEVPLAVAPLRLMFYLTRPVTQLVFGGRLQRFLAQPIQRGTVQMYQQWIGSHRGDRPPWSIEDSALKKAMGLRHVAPPQERRRERAVP